MECYLFEPKHYHLKLPYHPTPFSSSLPPFFQLPFTMTSKINVLQLKTLFAVFIKGSKKRSNKNAWSGKAVYMQGFIPTILSLSVKSDRYCFNRNVIESTTDTTKLNILSSLSKNDFYMCRISGLICFSISSNIHIEKANLRRIAGLNAIRKWSWMKRFVLEGKRSSCWMPFRWLQWQHSLYRDCSN